MTLRPAFQMRQSLPADFGNTDKDANILAVPPPSLNQILDIPIGAHPIHRKRRESFINRH